MPDLEWVGFSALRPTLPIAIFAVYDSGADARRSALERRHEKGR
jgi:hypothetical protein